MKTQRTTNSDYDQGNTTVNFELEDQWEGAGDHWEGAGDHWEGAGDHWEGFDVAETPGDDGVPNRDNLLRSPHRSPKSSHSGTNPASMGKVKVKSKPRNTSKRVSKKGPKLVGVTGGGGKKSASNDNKEDSENEESTNPTATAKRKKIFKSAALSSNSDEDNTKPQDGEAPSDVPVVQATVRRSVNGGRDSGIVTTAGLASENESNKRSVSTVSDGAAVNGVKRPRYWYEEITPVAQQSKQESPRGKGLRRKMYVFF